MRCAFWDAIMHQMEREEIWQWKTKSFGPENGHPKL
jgi:hypothetical protein